MAIIENSDYDLVGYYDVQNNKFIELFGSRVFSISSGWLNWVTTTRCNEHKSVNVYVLLAVHLSIILDNDQLEAQLLYFTISLLNPLHVSSIICSSSGGWIVLMQHLVSSSQSVAIRCTGWERTAEQFSLNLCTGWPLTGRTIPDAASIQFNLLMMSI